MARSPPSLAHLSRLLRRPLLDPPALLSLSLLFSLADAPSSPLSAAPCPDHCPLLQPPRLPPLSPSCACPAVARSPSSTSARATAPRSPRSSAATASSTRRTSPRRTTCVCAAASPWSLPLLALFHAHRGAALPIPVARPSRAAQVKSSLDAALSAFGKPINVAVNCAGARQGPPPPLAPPRRHLC